MGRVQPSLQAQVGLVRRETGAQSGEQRFSPPARGPDGTSSINFKELGI